MFYSGGNCFSWFIFSLQKSKILHDQLSITIHWLFPRFLSNFSTLFVHIFRFLSPTLVFFRNFNFQKLSLTLFLRLWIPLSLRCRFEKKNSFPSLRSLVFRSFPPPPPAPLRPSFFTVIYAPSTNCTWLMSTDCVKHLVFLVLSSNCTSRYDNGFSFYFWITIFLVHHEYANKKK